MNKIQILDDEGRVVREIEVTRDQIFKMGIALVKGIKETGYGDVVLPIIEMIKVANNELYDREELAGIKPKLP